MEPYGPHHHHHWRLPCMGCTSSYTSLCTPPCTPPCTPHCTPPCTLLVTPLPPTVQVHGLHTSLYCAIRPDCPGAMCQLRVCSCAPANERRMILGRKRSHGSELIFVTGPANICYLVVMVKMCPYNDSYTKYATGVHLVRTCPFIVACVPIEQESNAQVVPWRHVPYVCSLINRLQVLCRCR